VVALVAQLALGGLFVWQASRDFDWFGGGNVSSPSRPRAVGPATPRATMNRFDGTRAFALLREQVQQYGWRSSSWPARSRA
jgi:hypothetical protein